MDRLAAGGTRPWLAVGAEVARTLEQLDPAQFQAVLAEFSDATQRWFLTGQGRSGLAARMVAMRLMHLDRTVHVLGEATTPAVRARDGLVVISGSGATPASLRFASIARDEGARVVAVTAESDSALAQLANSTLTVPVPGSIQLGGSCFEQAALLILDGLVLALAARLADARATLAHRHTNMQ